MELLLSVILATVPLVEADPEDAEVVGLVGHRTVERGESLIEIAREHDVGFNALAAANPALDAFVPTPGADLIVPTSWIVPRAATRGALVVNLSEMRLYFFPGSAAPRVSFPVGVGMDGWQTPLGAFTVVSKTVNPTWYPPASVRRENPDLPARVAPGPDNPLGSHALRLSVGTILIHGTDQPYGIGRKASHGCIRLYPEDIPRLYEQVALKTRVIMVREPVKVGLRRGRVLVEAHADREARIDVAAEAARLLKARGLAARVDGRKLAAALQAHRGVPVDVSLDGL